MSLIWQHKIKVYFTNIWFLWTVCLIFNIITFLLLYFKIHPGDKTLALRYNVIIGVEWYGKGKNLYFIPGTAAAILFANFILFKKLKGNRTFYSNLCIFASFFVQIILFASTLFLITVN